MNFDFTRLALALSVTLLGSCSLFPGSHLPTAGKFKVTTSDDRDAPAQPVAVYRMTPMLLAKMRRVQRRRGLIRSWNCSGRIINTASASATC